MKNKLGILTILLLIMTLSLSVAKQIGSLGEYDAFMDADESGKIGPYDFAYFATIYGATGNTTKNVSVTNWPTEPEPKTIIVCENQTLTSGFYLFGKTHVEGYKYISFFVQYYRPSDTVVKIYVCPSCLNISWPAFDLLLNQYYDWYTCAYTGRPIESPEICFEVNVDKDSITFTLALYLYN